MKRAIAAALLLTLCLPFLCACTGRGIENSENTVIAGRQAGNEAVEYSFAYPDDWELAENSGIILIRKDTDLSDQYARYASLNVLTFTLSDASAGAYDYWKSYKEMLAETYKDFELIGGPEKEESGSGADGRDGEEINLGDTVARKVRFAASVTDVKYLYEQVICCRNGYVYIITFTSTNDDYDKIKDVMDTVLGTFTFD